MREDAAGNLEQSLIKDSGGMMSLSLGSDNKVKLTVRMSDGTAQTVTDPNAIVVNTWVHYAGTIDYVAARGGDTRIALCRDGAEVAQKSVTRALPCHLHDQVIDFDGTDDRVEIPNTLPSFANKSFSVEMWAKHERTGAQELLLHQGADGTNQSLHVGFRANNAFTFAFYANDLDTPSAYTDTGWHHWACTYDAATRMRRIYRDGALVIEQAASAHYQGSGAVTVGRKSDGTNAFKGKIADVRLWSRPRTAAEIAEDMARRLSGREPGLVGYWPLDNGAAKDLSQAKRHGTLQGSPVWQRAAYLHPQIVPPAAAGAKLARVMKFNGTSDFIEVPAYASPTSAMTVSLWARSATPVWNDHGCLVSKRPSFVLHPWKNGKSSPDPVVR